MNKLVSILAVVALLAIGLGVWLNQSIPKNTFESGPLFDDLHQYANQLDSIEIKNAQGLLFRAQRTDDVWLATHVAEQDYPISQENLVNFVDTMMRLQLVEAKTSKSKNYSRLGLQSIDSSDSMAHFVTFKSNEKSWQVLIGSQVNMGQGRYILKTNDPQSWRTDKNIKLPLDNMSWLKQPILPFAAAEIRSVARIDNPQWQIERSNNGEFELINLPNGRSLEYPSILNSIASNLTSINFEKLHAPDEGFVQSLTILSKLEVITTDNKIFALVVSEVNDKYFVNFSANGQPEYWQKSYYQVSHFSALQLIKIIDDFLTEDDSTPSIIEIKPKTVDEGESPY